MFIERSSRIDGGGDERSRTKDNDTLTWILRSPPSCYIHTVLLSMGDRAPNRDEGSPMAILHLQN